MAFFLRIPKHLLAPSLVDQVEPHDIETPTVFINKKTGDIVIPKYALLKYPSLNLLFIIFSLIRFQVLPIQVVNFFFKFIYLGNESNAFFSCLQEDKVIMPRVSDQVSAHFVYPDLDRDPLVSGVYIVHFNLPPPLQKIIIFPPYLRTRWSG